MTSKKLGAKILIRSPASYLISHVRCEIENLSLLSRDFESLESSRECLDLCSFKSSKKTKTAQGLPKGK